jgi:hypothetical protein
MTHRARKWAKVERALVESVIGTTSFEKESLAVVSGVLLKAVSLRFAIADFVAVSGAAIVIARNCARFKVTVAQ